MSQNILRILLENMKLLTTIYRHENVNPEGKIVLREAVRGILSRVIRRRGRRLEHLEESCC